MPRLIGASMGARLSSAREVSHGPKSRALPPAATNGEGELGHNSDQDPEAHLLSSDRVGSADGHSPVRLEDLAGLDDDEFTYDLFLSHLQRNAQNTVIAMNLFLRDAAPAIRTFIDLEVNMNKRGGLTDALRDGVRRSRALLFFITDGIFRSEWCCNELRWAREMGRIIILVNETDPRHGGIDMKVAIRQAPDDLKSVLRDKIAIPWYRQPEFRDVSVQRILQAAEVKLLKDGSWAKTAQDASDDIRSIMEDAQDRRRVTAIDVICRNSLAMRVVFFFGGLYEFDNKGVDAMYVSLFNLSFWFCGGVCTANLFYQAVPFHVISTDLLTAYVHLPAWQGWLFWRGYVHSEASNNLLSAVMSNPKTAETVTWLLPIAGAIVLALQVAMVGVVLGGFSLPHALGLSGALPSSFTAVHAESMCTLATTRV